MTAGICWMCQCRDDDPCDGGCSWANAERTQCTQCEVAEKLVAAFFIGADRACGRPALEWQDRPDRERQHLTMLFRGVAETWLTIRAEDVLLLAKEVGPLMETLAQRYPKAVEQACQREASLQDLVIGLLDHPERRVQIIGG